jgi:hypothetical protein
MPTYRFNLEDHHYIADRVEHYCDDQSEAEAMANEIADRLVEEQPSLLDGGHAIVVRDTTNRPVYRAGMDRASIVKRRN